MNNLKNAQIVTVKVTVNNTSFTYEVLCKPTEDNQTLFRKAKARARVDFGDLLDTEKVSYEVGSRKTLNS